MSQIITGLKAVGMQTPPLLGRVTSALRYFLTGAMAVITGGDMYKQYQSSIIFWLTMAVLFTGAIDVFIGQQPPQTTQQN